MAITFCVEVFDQQLINDLEPLLFLHWQEIARNKDTIKLDPDYGAYIALQENDCLLITTARNNGRLIGYIVNIIAPNLHYKTHLMANNDILFVMPEYRGRHVFDGLLNFTFTELKKRGVEMAYIHMKTSHDFGAMLEKKGATFIEKNYEFKLDG